MPGGGIEPPQAFWALRILSPLRLPISPSRLITLASNPVERALQLCPTPESLAKLELASRLRLAGIEYPILACDRGHISHQFRRFRALVLVGAQ